MVQTASYDSCVYSNILNQRKKNNREACIMITVSSPKSLHAEQVTASKLLESKTL